MGKIKRPVPAKLSKKLKAIRENVGLTGQQMIEKLDCESLSLHRAHISKYENGLREPPLIVILQYANLAKVTVNVLIDDKLDLPF